MISKSENKDSTTVPNRNIMRKSALLAAVLVVGTLLSVSPARAKKNNQQNNQGENQQDTRPDSAPTTVPEPATYLLLAAGIATVFVAGRKRFLVRQS